MKQDEHRRKLEDRLHPKEAKKEIASTKKHEGPDAALQKAAHLLPGSQAVISQHSATSIPSGLVVPGSGAPTSAPTPQKVPPKAPQKQPTLTQQMRKPKNPPKNPMDEDPQEQEAILKSIQGTKTAGKKGSATGSRADPCPRPTLATPARGAKCAGLALPPSSKKPKPSPSVLEEQHQQTMESSEDEIERKH